MSDLLKTSAHFIIQIMLVLSILLVVRGHHFPGGGFVGALVGTSAIALYTLAFSLKAKGFDLLAPFIVAAGLVCLLMALFAGILVSKPMLAAVWWSFDFFGNVYKIGTPLLFDFGIYFLILGSLSWLIAELEDK